MCNLYSATTNQDAIRALARAMRHNAGNMPPLPGTFPDYAAPIVRTGADGVRELVRARWGVPSPAFTLQGKKVDKGVTNVRNTAGPHWRRLAWAGLALRGAFHLVQRTHAPGRWTQRACMVRPRQHPPDRLLRRHLDELDMHAEGGRGRGNVRPVRLPHDRT